MRPNPNLLIDQPGLTAARAFIAAAQNVGCLIVILYLPLGGRVELDTDLAGLTGCRVDPRTGASQPISVDADGNLDTPSEVDWVVVLKESQ